MTAKTNSRAMARPRAIFPVWRVAEHHGTGGQEDGADAQCSTDTTSHQH
jgi:hypothetical protein